MYTNYCNYNNHVNTSPLTLFFHFLIDDDGKPVEVEEDTEMALLGNRLFLVFFFFTVQQFKRLLLHFGSNMRQKC